jgi:hypothetical protein
LFIKLLKFFRNIAIAKSKQKACIELFIKPDGSWQFNYISVIRKERGQIEISDEHTNLDKLDSIKKILANKLPLCLVINGKTIISKRIRLSENEGSGFIIQKVLPGVRADEFYMRTYPASDNNIYVSLIRISLLEEIIEFFKENKINLVEIFWGPFSVNSIISLTGIEHGEIITEQFRFIISDKKISDYSLIEIADRSDELFTIGNEKLKRQSLVSFSVLINHFFDNNGENTSGAPIIVNSENEFIYSKMFVKSAWYALVIVFVVLLANFILFDYYSSKDRNLTSEVNQYSDVLINQDTLKKELESKTDLLEKSGLLESSRISFYTDRIASVVNEGITLTRFEVNPINERTGEDVEETGYRFKNDSIQITGTASNSTYLNEW